MNIRPGRPEDARTVLALFDEAVAWLVARGQPGQWGTEPFSAFPARVERAEAWASSGGLLRRRADDARAARDHRARRPRRVGRAAGPAGALRRGARHLARPQG